MFIDYTKCKTTQEMLQLLEQVADEYRKSNEKFLAVNDFTGNFGDNKFMDRAKELGPLVFDAKTEKSAILGITGVKKILLQGYNKFVKNKQVPFNTQEEALEYLVSEK
jgi:hypothetical protein